MNLAASEETFAHAINIPLQGDDFDSIRVEYMSDAEFAELELYPDFDE